METNQTDQTEDQPPAGYKRIKLEARTMDVKIALDPLPDRVFGYVGSEAGRFDHYANELYAAGAKLVEDAYADDTAEYQSPIDAATQARIDAYYCAVQNLRQAAEHLRAVKLALSPYVDLTLLTRGY